MNQKTIPFRFILRFFWPTIPESIPEKRPKTVKESELRFFWNRNCDSFGIDTALVLRLAWEEKARILHSGNMQKIPSFLSSSVPDRGQ